MEYRPEVDGLRALAVVPVLLFHAGWSTFSGGYVGVDIFFVISGYLITSLLIEACTNGSMSLLDFYMRRIRRILPALFCMIIVCIPIAFWLLDTHAIRQFFRSISAVTVFSSNILFWNESGYFDATADVKPLLHTWSLSVEEQYYLFFPLFVMMVLPYGKRIFGALLVILLVLSLFLAQWFVQSYPTATFYLLPTRAWELLAGALTAVYLSRRNQNTIATLPSQWLSLFGFMLIVYGILFFDADTTFPTSYALFPVMGTTLIILYCRPGTWVHRLLSASLAVSIGLISYSLYLWHQPLLVFARTWRQSELGHLDTVMVLMLSVCVAYLSWRFVEKPFRRGRVKAKPIYAAALLASFSLFSVGLWGHLTIDNPSRLDLANSTVDIPEKFPGIKLDGEDCSFPSFDPLTVCQIKGTGDESLRLVIIGDSHARVLSEAFANSPSEYGELIDLTAWGCPFLPNLSITLAGDKTHCPEEYQRQRVEFLKTLGKENLHIVVSARLPWYLYSDGFDNSIGGVEFVQGVSLVELENAEAIHDTQRYLDVIAQSVETLSSLSEKVYLVMPNHTNGWDPISRALRLADGEMTTEDLEQALSVPSAPVLKRLADFESLFNQLAQRFPAVTLVDPTNFTCNFAESSCYGFKAGKFLFSDDDHLSLVVNEKIANQIFRDIHGQKVHRVRQSSEPTSG